MVKAGRVERRIVAQGTKSERTSVVLVAADGEYILRRAEANPFGDPGLDALVGRCVTCEGTVLAGSTFEASAIKPLDGPQT